MKHCTCKCITFSVYDIWRIMVFQQVSVDLIKLISEFTNVSTCTYMYIASMCLTFDLLGLAERIPRKTLNIIHNQM